MNKLEARSLLVLITFFASIQYVFIGAAGDDYSTFGFLCITNLIGLVMMLILLADDNIFKKLTGFVGRKKGFYQEVLINEKRIKNNGDLNSVHACSDSA